jgi:hypothetical protein
VSKFTIKCRRLLNKKWVSQSDLIDALELLAADIYAHDTEDGWCCACEIDIAFAEAWLRRTKPEIFKPAKQGDKT